MKVDISSTAVALLLAACPLLTLAQQIEPPAPLGKPATKAYRQIMPDGSVVYSDKVLKGGKPEQTVVIDAEATGSVVVTEPPRRAPVPLRPERTEVRRVVSTTKVGKEKSLDDADADVIRAEMLLEDAHRQQKSGVEPLPGERTGNAAGGSRLNEDYKTRQQALAHKVDEAEALLRQAVAERDALRKTK